MKVSPDCLGAMMFGAMGNPDSDETTRIIHKALDAGINFIDTADAYSQGGSEEVVGKALKGRRDSVVLSTRVYHPIDEIVPPGADIAPLEGAAYLPPALKVTGLRRRPISERTAA